MKPAQNWFIFFMFAAVVIIARLPSLSAPLDNDSGAVAYHAALINAGEPLYGTHHPAHHLPGIYYTYAIIFKLLGTDISNVKLVLMLWVWANSLLLFVLGQRIAGRPAGTIAALVFILTTSMTQLQGETGEMELFANLPLTLVVALAFEFLRTNRKPIYYLVIGAIGAVCILFKPVYISSLVAVLGTLFFLALQGWTREYWKVFIQRCFAIGTGFISIVAIVFVYFMTAGVFDRLLLSLWLGTQYVEVNIVPVFYVLSLPLQLLARANWVLALAGLTGLVWIIITFLRRSLATGNTFYRVMILIWGVTSIIIAGVSKLAYAHYSLLLVPSFSLLAIMYAFVFFEKPNQEKKSTHLVRFSLGGGVLSVIIINTLIQGAPDLNKYINYLSGRISYENYLLASDPKGYSALKVADYIEAHSNSSDSLFGWTDSAQIYFLAARRSASDVLWPSYIERIESPDKIISKEPLYIVVAPTFFEGTRRPQWLDEWITQSYILEETIDSHHIYKRLTP